MTRFVVGDDRSQSTLFPERLNDYLGERPIDVREVARGGHRRAGNRLRQRDIPGLRAFRAFSRPRQGTIAFPQSITCMTASMLH